MKKLIIWIAILFIASLVIRISREYIYEPEVEKPKEDKLGVLIEQLAMCESSGREDIRIIDSNGLYSYGLLQFQSNTWISKAKQYNIFPEAEQVEYMNFIYDGEYQKKVAREILKEPNGWRNWFTCSRKLNIDKLALGQE